MQTEKKKQNSSSTNQNGWDTKCLITGISEPIPTLESREKTIFETIHRSNAVFTHLIGDERQTRNIIEEKRNTNNRKTFNKLNEC